MVQHSATSCNMIGRAGISDARASRAALYPTRHSIRRGRLLCHEPLELREVRRAHVRCTLVDQPLQRTPCNGHRATDTVQRTTRNGQQETDNEQHAHVRRDQPCTRRHARRMPRSTAFARAMLCAHTPSRREPGRSRCRCGRGEPIPEMSRAPSGFELSVSMRAAHEWPGGKKHARAHKRAVSTW